MYLIKICTCGYQKYASENYFDALRKTKTENKNLKVVYNNLNEDIYYVISKI